jgi:hypothetical protein
LWQNSFYSLTTTSAVKSSLNWRNNYLILNNQFSSTYGSAQLVVPDNGTKTGTYSTFTYLPTAFSLNNSTLTSSTQTNVSSTTSLTDSTATLVSATGSVTQTLTAL